MMKSVEPQIVGTKKRIAEDQPEYTPVTVVLATHAEYSAPQFGTQRWH